jgi:glycosyltransferase involved in cell wall biosynthesis
MLSLIKYWIEYFSIKKSGMFDAEYYLLNYFNSQPDHITVKVDPLYHFIAKGWKEGKNPSRSFNTKEYLEMNPDVRDAGVNPLFHYIRFGKREGRWSSSGGFSASDHHSSQRKYLPKVSVIVTNYNHAPFLRKRLDSIYQQTYKNFEVILLDDHSTDHSIGILKEYALAYPEKTRCYFNDTNTGSPFAQWKKGIAKAEGELIWIAESDDYCDENFLEYLVPNFFDDSVMLSYANMVFVDRDEKKHVFSFEKYVAEFHPRRWTTSFVETAHNEVIKSLGLINTIPNVSGAVFRKPNEGFALFKDPDWEKMLVCGDWLFYLHLIRGGKIAYCSRTHDYFRLHEDSTSKKTQVQDLYYLEHEKVANAVAGLYKVPESLFSHFSDRLKKFYFENVPNGSLEKYSACFNLAKIIASRKSRNPNVLMVTYGFIVGGGEIFPLHLANALYKQGAGITVFNGGYGPAQLNVRKMLYPQIPVINYDQHTMKKLVRNFGIEIIHTHHVSMERLFAAVKPEGISGIKHVATMHGMYELIDNFLVETKKARQRVDHWFYISDKNVVPFRENGLFDPIKFSKIDNGMPDPTVHPVDLSPLGITPESFTICLASRALPEKGWMEAIKATQKAREATQKDIHLLLLGAGPLFEALQEQGVPEFIHLLGFKENVDDYLAVSQLGLLPSYYKGESFPLVIIQYFMAEIPVIASKVGEIPRMMTADNQETGGLLIELQDGKVVVDKLADALVKLILNTGFYAGCVLTARLLKKRYHIDNIAKIYLAAYKQLAN